MPNYNPPTHVQPGAQRRVGWDGVDWNILVEAANTRTVRLQFQDRGVNVSGRRQFLYWLSDDADGASLTGDVTPPNTRIGGTGADLHEVVADELAIGLTDANSAAQILIGPVTGADTYYLAVVDPQGLVHVSPAITFAA